jgi:hypothetical protein
MGHFEIGILNNDGSITKVKHILAGSVVEIAKTLTRYYTDEEKVNELISKGDLLQLSAKINPSSDSEHSWWTGFQNDVNLYCNRDRNDSWEKVKPVTYFSNISLGKTIEEWKNDAKENKSEFLYLFRDGSWELYSLKENTCWTELNKHWFINR